MKKKFHLFWLILFCCFIQSGWAKDNIPPLDLDKLKSGEQTLVIGYIPDFPPFYIPDTAILKGMDVDIFNDVSKRAGIKRISYSSFKDYASLNQALEDGKIDIIVCDYWDLPKNKARFLLSEPYYVRDGIALVAKKYHHYTSLGRMKGHFLGVYKAASDIVDWVQNHVSHKVKVKIFDSRPAMINALENNDIGATAVHFTLFHYLNQSQVASKKYTIVLLQSFNTVYALRKQDDKLLTQINQALDSMWSDGSLYNIKKKYLNPIGIDPAQRKPTQ